MARPSPEIILTKDTGYYELDILACSGYWIIAYKGEPISIRQRLYAVDGVRMKYPRTGFSNKAHCENLATKLNKQFKCTDFTCTELVNELEFYQENSKG